MAPRSTSRGVQVLFSLAVGFESFCVIMSVPLKDAVGRFAILWSYWNATYWQKLQGGLSTSLLGPAQGKDVAAMSQNFQPNDVLTPRSFWSARTGGLLSKFSYT